MHFPRALAQNETQTAVLFKPSEQKWTVPLNNGRFRRQAFSEALTSKPTRVSSSLIGCPIQSALCHIEAKNFVNYSKLQQARLANLHE